MPRGLTGSFVFTPRLPWGGKPAVRAYPATMLHWEPVFRSNSCGCIHSKAAAAQTVLGSTLHWPRKCDIVFWGKSIFPLFAKMFSTWSETIFPLPREWIWLRKGICGGSLPQIFLLRMWCRTRSSPVSSLPSWKSTLFYLGPHEYQGLTSSWETGLTLNLNVQTKPQRATFYRPLSHMKAASISKQKPRN